jgi:hypothetical protein
MIWHDINHYHKRTVLDNAVFDFTATWRLKLRAIVENPLAFCLIHGLIIVVMMFSEDVK